MNKADWVINFMGHPCSQLSQRTHFFRLNELRLNVLQISDRIGQLLGLLTGCGEKLGLLNRYAKEWS